MQTFMMVPASDSVRTSWSLSAVVTGLIRKFCRTHRSFKRAPGLRKYDPADRLPQAQGRRIRARERRHAQAVRHLTMMEQ